MLFFFALLSCLTAQNFLTKPVKKDSTTSVNLGPADLLVSGISFQYWINDYLSLNTLVLSYMHAAGYFNAVGNVHLPIETFNTYFGPRRIFWATLAGTLDLATSVVRGLKLKRFLWRRAKYLGNQKLIVTALKQSWLSFKYYGFLTKRSVIIFLDFA